MTAQGARGAAELDLTDPDIPYGAQGTRLNKRSIETRRHILDVAVAILASCGPQGASVNALAGHQREPGTMESP